MSNNEMPDPEKVKEIMQVISETVPSLLSSITKVLYGAKEGEEYGKAVANFYKSVKSTGMSNEEAFALTKDYMGNFNLGNIMKGVASRERSKED